MESADTFIFLISPDSVQSEVCGGAIDHAVKNGKRMIPIVVREVSPKEVHTVLSRLNWIFFRESDDFNTAIQKLLNAINTDYDWVKSHRRLQMKALEWERSDKESSFLLRGKDLQDAEFQLATNTSKEPHPTDLQRDYTFRSRQAADRARRITAGISVAGIIALAGLAGCRWPRETIVPRAYQPAGQTPGLTRSFATAFELAGSASGLLVTSFEGRPIKVEGNPQDPSGRGAADALAQAAILELYDPDRSRDLIRRDGGGELRQ
ncbi:MAG: TIR domain-containing protein, partial [Nitrospirales bacterium]|nr:TIR domain-containing protein [Nitrospirales bacterium]